METKACKKCGVEKEVVQYGMDRKSRKSVCKECAAEKTRLYYKNNPEKVKASSERRRDKRLAQAKIYREKNKEKVSLAHKKWRQENKDYDSFRKKERYNKKKEQISLKRSAKRLINIEQTLEKEKILRLRWFNSLSLEKRREIREKDHKRYLENKHTEKYKQSVIVKSKERALKLTKGYIKGNISKKYDIKRVDIPDDFVESYREYHRAKQLLLTKKQKQNGKSK